MVGPEYEFYWDNLSVITIDLQGCRYIQRHCLPTYRGYETFLGYYTACTSDYWMHGAPGNVSSHGPCNDIDFHNSTGTHIAGADMTGPNSVNGTYDQVVFTQRAVKHIHDVAGTGDPLFLYVIRIHMHHICCCSAASIYATSVPLSPSFYLSAFSLTTTSTMHAQKTVSLVV